MTSFNTNAPNTIGLEWRPITEGVLALASPTTPVAVKIPAGAVETISSIPFAHQWAGSGAGFGRLWADIYAAADYAETDLVTVRYQPNEDIGNDGYITRSDWGTTTQIYNQISDTDDDEDPWNDYAVNTDAGRVSKCRFMFNTSTFPSGMRPLSVSFEIRALGYSWSWQAPSIELSHWYNGNKKGVFGSFSVPRDDTWATYSLGPYYFDFNDEGPWNRQSILDFDTASGTKDHVGVEWRYGCKITRLTMVVTYVTDKRVATAQTAKITSVPGGVITTTGLSTLTPGTSVAANWSKAATDYLVVVRRIDKPSTTTFTPSLLYIDSGDGPPGGIGAIASGASLVDAGGQMTPASADALSTRAACFALGTSGGAQSVDSQPYYDIEAKPISWSNPVSQAVAGASAQSYKRVRMQLGVDGTPSYALHMGIRRTTIATGLGDASEAWTGANGAAWPAQWNNGSGSTGATATIQGNAGQMTTGTTAAGYYRRLLNVALNSSVLAQAKVTFTGVGAANSARVFLGGTTFTNDVLNSSYEVRLTANSNTVAVYRIDGAGAATLAATSSFTFAAATQYTVKVMRFASGFLGVKVWATAGTEPDAWQTSIVPDTTYTVSRLALGVLGGVDTSSDTITFDDLSVWQYLGAGDLTAANLSDANIASYRGAVAYSPGTLSVHDVLVTLDTTATLAAATDYTVELAAYGAAQWYLLWAQAASFGLTGNVTYGGSTDAAAPGAAVATATADFMLTLGSVPTALAGQTATQNTQALPDAGDIMCAVPSLEYATIAWTASALGASFMQYEIERSEDGGASYYPVVWITTEATTSWSDYQSPRGVAVQYRLRVVRSDGAVSDWVTTGAVTCNASGQVVLFTSNEDPSINTGFVLLGDERPYSFPGADDLVLIRRYGLNFMSAFRPIERRGASWDFRVLIYTHGDSTDVQGSPPDGRGIRAFDTLRNIAETQSSVALLTPDGERLFCALRVPEGIVYPSAQHYQAPVSAYIVSDEPVLVVI